MVEITIQLPVEQAERLAEDARRLEVTVEDLARAHVLDRLAQPAREFERASRYVLRKNAKLYRRLA